MVSQIDSNKRPPQEVPVIQPSTDFNSFFEEK